MCEMQKYFCGLGVKLLQMSVRVNREVQQVLQVQIEYVEEDAKAVEP
jgi:hypothetical protein